jgi:hypothetical protein
VPQFGKNVIGFKLWLASQMKEDLQKLADHAGVKLSAFAREVIISDLIGHGSSPERPEMFEAASEAALAWERDDDVPVETIEVANFNGLGSADRHWVENGTGDAPTSNSPPT